MEREYRDKDANLLTREEVQQLPPEELSDRSGLLLNILPDTDGLHESIADVMIETILGKEVVALTARLAHRYWCLSSGMCENAVSAVALS